MNDNDQMTLDILMTMSDPKQFVAALHKLSCSPDSHQVTVPQLWLICGMLSGFLLMRKEAGDDGDEGSHG